MKTTGLDPLVLIQIAQSVSWHAHHDQGGTASAAKRVLQAIPDTFALRTYVALVNGYGAWRGTLDFHALRKEIGERLDALADEWLAAYPDAEQRRQALAEATEHVRNNMPSKSASSSEFHSRLIHGSPELARAIIEDAIAKHGSRTRRYAWLALAKILHDDRPEGQRVIGRFFAEQSTDLMAAVGKAYWIVTLEGAGSQDMANIRRLLASDDAGVVLSAIETVRTHATSDARLAIDLVTQTNLGISDAVADAALSAFYTVARTPFSLFTRADVVAILQRLEPIPEFEGHWIETFLARASRHFPRETAQFFMRRVDRAADANDWHIRPCNFGPYGHVALQFRQAAECAALLREVSTWMNGRDVKDVLFHERAKQLFGAMFSPFDDVLVGFLSDWVHIAGEKDMRTIAHILDEAPSEFVFTHRAFVDEALNKAKQFGQKMLDRFIGVLCGSAISGMRTGTPGEPFPQDLKMKADAEAVLENLPRFSPARELYDDIRRSADQRIGYFLRRAEEFED